MDNKATARQVIRAAVAAAGGPATAGPKLGVTSQAVSGWLERGQVPAKRIRALCDLGGNAITSDQILEAMEREAQVRDAA